MACNLQIGDKVQFGSVYRLLKDGAHINAQITSILENKRVVLFGGPAPFSRLDTEQALEYAALSMDFKKYVDDVCGIYCQDAFVMNQFDLHIKKTYPEHSITFYGDGDAFFVRNYGLEYDFTHQGLSIRSCRYALVLNNQIVEHVALDDYTEVVDTSASKILEFLKTAE